MLESHILAERPFFVYLNSHDTPTSRKLACGKQVTLTREGVIHCFGSEETNPQIHRRPNVELAATPLADRARHVLDRAKVNEGYCIVLGVGTGQLVDELLRQSDLRLIVIDADEDRVQKLRERFADSDLYGTRISVCNGDFTSYSMPPYMANLIVTENIQAAGFELDESFADAVFAALRPYGGTAIVALSDDEHQVLQDLVWELPNAVVKRDGSDAILIRSGALEGSADSTDEYGNPANSLVSKDQLVKPPFGVLWFGGPSTHPDLFYDRHNWAPSVTIVNGRMFMEGPERLTTVDVYTGRILWQRELKQGLSPGRGANWEPTGFHLVAAADAIYLAYEKTYMVLDPVTGDLETELNLPEADDQFGRIRVHEDRLIVTVFRRTDKGNQPVKLVAMDRHDGHVVWQRESISSFPFVAQSNDRVFAFEGHLEDLFNNRERHGLVPKASELKQLLAFDIRTGDQLWSGRTDRVVTWLAYSEETDMLIASNKRGMEGWQATKGEKLWTKTAEGVGFRGHPENLWDKVVLWKDRIIDQRGPGKSYDTRTGEPTTIVHPITGEEVAWEFTKKGHHCGYAIGAENLITFRAAEAAYLDMSTGGTTHFKGFRSGCRNSLVPANGVLSAPNFADECICSYSIFTSLALVHVPEAEKWSYSALKPLKGQVNRLGINFGAPGDRRVPDGSLWLDFPSVGGSSPNVEIQVAPKRPRTFRSRASMIQGEGLSWVAASGIEGLSSLTVHLGEETDAPKQYTLRFSFAEPDDLQPGDRVFSVSAGDKKILDDIDLVRESGGRHRILVKECRGVMANGELHLSFDAEAGKPLICGLEVVAEDAIQ